MLVLPELMAVHVYIEHAVWYILLRVMVSMHVQVIHRFYTYTMLFQMGINRIWRDSVYVSLFFIFITCFVLHCCSKERTFGSEKVAASQRCKLCALLKRPLKLLVLQIEHRFAYTFPLY